ncbi:MAG: threonine--tRNA ligase [Myxococcales bacterium]|nr:MAG: threonine--tRNA ligase [Myxococcales bacterium]
MGSLAISLNEKKLELERGVSAREALAKAEALKNDVVAAKLNGKVVDLGFPLSESGTLEPVALQSEEGIDVLRHSTAHLMAQAVMRLFPKAKLAIGPTVENGFYYDIDFSGQAFSAEDLPRIEEEMRKIVKERLPIRRQEVSREEAMAIWKPAGEIYKVELIEGLPEGSVISTYNQGEFTDLCRGPHAPDTGWLRVFKLMTVAGAYWRGDEKNQMLTRIYGTAWPTKDQLHDYLKRLEEAERRDHRKLGKTLELFTICDEVGKGLPLWLPNGAVLREELEKLAKETEWRYGYQRVVTPEITKAGLYKISGHLEHYKDSMFPPMTLPDEDEQFYLKPMNCPHHHMIFRSRPRSYREMPLRLAEYGRVYRYEKSGELAGLLRVRGMCMNDAHLYVPEDNLKDEFKAVIQMHLEYYNLLGIADYQMRLSLHDPAKDKFVADPEQWAKAERVCAEAMDELGIGYRVAYGEAAFYGPKVDVQFRNVLGREETNGTNQVDFVAAERFGLRYVGKDGQLHKPVVLHRAPLGTHERFIAFLIEHFIGAFPTWLAPVQVVIIPVAPELAEYGRKLKDDLYASFVRVVLDDSGETLNKKIRNATTQYKAPNLLIIGEKERTSESVTLRRYGLKRQETWPYAQFKEWLLDQVRRRTLPDRDIEE